MLWECSLYREYGPETLLFLCESLFWLDGIIKLRRSPALLGIVIEINKLPPWRADAIATPSKYLDLEFYIKVWLPTFYLKNIMNSIMKIKCQTWFFSNVICSKWNVIRQFNWRYDLSPLCSAIICVPHPCSFVAMILIHWRKVTGWRQSSVRMIQLQCKYFSPSISLTKITK